MLNLERDGMPDWEPPCDHGKPCIGKVENKRTGDVHEVSCDLLGTQTLDFGVCGKFLVHWCQRNIDDGECELFTAEQARWSR